MKKQKTKLTPRQKQQIFRENIKEIGEIIATCLFFYALLFILSLLPI